VCNRLQSFTYDSPSRLRFLFSIPFPCSYSVDIPDSLEVLDSPLGVRSDTSVALSFGSNSHLRDLRLFTVPDNLDAFLELHCRAFVRLCESTLRSFRSNLSADSI
jgi:hypothetical protein